MVSLHSNTTLRLQLCNSQKLNTRHPFIGQCLCRPHFINTILKHLTPLWLLLLWASHWQLLCIYTQRSVNFQSFLSSPPNDSQRGARSRGSWCGFGEQCACDSGQLPSLVAGGSHSGPRKWALHRGSCHMLFCKIFTLHIEIQNGPILLHFFVITSEN